MKNLYEVKVAKFGGSSLADAAQMKKCADIIKAEPSRRFVVPSAPGKRFREDVKVTDLLINCFALRTAGGEWLPVLDTVKEPVGTPVEEIDKETPPAPPPVKKPNSKYN